ncbi:MAG TPA: energy-coupling factor transporter transmembrane protein EcfT [Clostridiaceae bacterium]|nr:energy-coupling factor transporter transmembrane protein EcfT [Clostridiaceae bacterium]
MKFDSYHPVINFIYFTTVITMSIIFDQPVFLSLSYLCSFIYSISLNGTRSAVFNVILIPFIVAFALYYASYNHFGITNITVNFIGNQITLESLLYGAALGIKIASVLMWFSCVHKVISSDKIIYLFGRVLPKLSLLLSLALRLVPRIKTYAKAVNTAQSCIGRGLKQGKILQRMRSLIRLLSILVTWTMEHIVAISDSMRSRGYSLKGRTAFSIYRFDNRDRSFVIALFFYSTLILAGVLLDQTNILYDPEIIMNKMTPLSLLFYLAYVSLCILPLALQLLGEYKADMLRAEIEIQ